MDKGWITSSFIVLCVVTTPISLADVSSVISVENNKVGQFNREKLSLEENAKMWGLTKDEYRQYLKEMSSTPSARWWKNVDPPQVLGMNAKTEAERMHYAKIDVAVDYEKMTKEIAFQHAYDKAFSQMYPNAKPISEAQNSSNQAGSVRSSDRFYLFTSAKDPEGGLMSTEIINQIGNKSNISFNIFFVGHASYSEIQEWAKENNIPKAMTNGDRVTLNHNKSGDGDMLKRFMKTTNVTLPILIRVRHNESRIMKGVGL